MKKPIHLPSPSVPSLHPNNIIREIGFKCSNCGDTYIAYELSDSVRTPVPCPTCRCDVFGERLGYNEELQLKIDVAEKRKKNKEVDNARSLEDLKRYRSTPKRNIKNARVKPELDKKA